MELLNLTTKKNLLEAGLETLHEESITWINTIKFWEDESKFYKNIIDNKLFETISLKDKNEIHKIINDIIENKLIVFKSKVDLHEKNLSTLLSYDSDPVNYRNEHHLLLNEFSEFEKQMVIYKKTIFELLQLVNKNFLEKNETISTINERRSVRKYKKDIVEKDIIEQIIKAGRLAPSARNKQPSKFYILSNTEKIKKYSKEICKVSENIFQLLLKNYRQEDDAIFHSAPIVVFITGPKDNEWASIDIGMCAQNMMLAAKSMGIDSCPIGLAKAIEYTPIYKELHIPDTEEIKIAIVFGIGDEKPKTPERKTDNIYYLK